MSLLRDGIHRRAPLTARFGAARFGAARFGCVYGQDDLAELTREIKDEALTGEGPFYVWAETLPIASPFGGRTQYIAASVTGGLAIGGTSTISTVFSVNLALGGSSTDYLNPAMVGGIRLGGGEDTDIEFTTGSQISSQRGKIGPGPFGPGHG